VLLLQGEKALPSSAASAWADGSHGASFVADLLDGHAVKSCTMLAAQAQGSHITTIEGLAPASSGALHPVQAAFSKCHALQCGFCTPGMVMATVSLLQKHPKPTDAQITEGLSGNLCRCTGYINIAQAVKEAAAQLAS
jgi:carbon-monoxide dehydrogenase small subunit